MLHRCPLIYIAIVCYQLCLCLSTFIVLPMVLWIKTGYIQISCYRGVNIICKYYLLLSFHFMGRHCFDFWRINFDCGLFRLPDLDILNMGFEWFGDKAHGGCDRSAEYAYSSMAPDPTFAFVGGPCCPTLDFFPHTYIWMSSAWYVYRHERRCKNPYVAVSYHPVERGEGSSGWDHIKL
jgi:hypothetical protein